jgi:hypothetical protein
MSHFRGFSLSLWFFSAWALLACGSGGATFKNYSSPGSSKSSTTQSVDTVTSGVSITTPTAGETLTSPFQLNAQSAYCNGQPVASMAYSIGNGTDSVAVEGTSLNALASAQAGSNQVLHVKSWGNEGAACDKDVNISIKPAIVATPTPTPVPTSAPSPMPSPSPSVSSAGPIIPANAVANSNIESDAAWNCLNNAPASGTGSTPCNYDPGTHTGSANGSSSLVGSVLMNGKESRQFLAQYKDWGGEIFHHTFDHDATATSFVYENYVWISSSGTGTLGNIEMDLNQVISNGNTVIYGFQCAGTSGTWDYTENEGTPAKPVVHWVHSKAACNPRNWPKDKWNHVQIAYSRDAVGNITYQSVWLNGVPAYINATVPSAFALKWGAAILLTNFQLDGGDAKSGEFVVYSNGMRIYRW